MAITKDNVPALKTLRALLQRPEQLESHTLDKEPRREKAIVQVPAQQHQEFFRFATMATGQIESKRQAMRDKRRSFIHSFTSYTKSKVLNIFIGKLSGLSKKPGIIFWEASSRGFLFS
jgi:hypothetical protein